MSSSKERLTEAELESLIDFAMASLDINRRHALLAFRELKGLRAAHEPPPVTGMRRGRGESTGCACQYADGGDLPVRHNEGCPAQPPPAVQSKITARDVHYRLIEEFRLADDPSANAVVRGLLEQLSAGSSQPPGAAPESELSAEQESRAMRMFLDGLGVDSARLIVGLQDQVTEYEQSFDLRRKADMRAIMRAIKRWREAHPGNDLRWPDHDDLCVWLLEQLEGAAEPDARCISTEDGGCISEDCMHTQKGESSDDGQ